MKRLLRRLLRPAARGARQIYNPQFNALSFRADELSNQMTSQIHMVNLKLDELKPTFESFNDSLARRIEAERERTTYQQRLLTGLESSSAGLQAAAERIEQLTSASSVARMNADLDRALERAQLGLSAAELDAITARGDSVRVTQAMAEVINWSNSHLGASSRDMLWFNEPIKVRITPLGAEVTDVTERIVEIPYVLGALHRLPTGADILDFGSAESTISLSLASLGNNVISSDLRAYPMSHPKLQSVTGPIEQWEPPVKFDAIISLSTLEHVGLGAYSENETPGDLDAVIVEKFASWLKPDGIFVLTAPFGVSKVDALQRTYDTASIDALFKGWSIIDRRTFRTNDGLTWQPESENTSWKSGHEGVICITARPNA